MTTLYPAARDLVLNAEGPGGTAEPGDAGLLTVFGITMGYDSTWAGWPYANEVIAQKVSPEMWIHDLKLMAFVDQFYSAQWNEAHMDGFKDQALANSYFGAYVNEGPKVAKFLQTVIGVSADGILGPATFSILDTLNPRQVLSDFKLARIWYYDATASLADLRGLINRVRLGA